MSNPITELQGGGPWPDETTTPLPAQQAPPQPQVQPQSPGMPPMTLDMNPAPAPTVELQGGGPWPEAPAGVAPDTRPSALTAPAVPDTLGGPDTSSTLTPTAPKTTGNQEAYNYLAPRIQQEVLGARRQAQETYNSALDPNAVPVQREWEAPDLEESITRFGYNSKVLAESFKRQSASRQNEDERAWLERNMAAIEAMNKPQSSATADSMDWVSRMLGTSQDGVRQYVGPAVFDKAKGEWVGSPVGGVLYGLGILQNSAMGAIYDVTNLFHNVDKGLRQAYESFTPPWARGTTDSALKTLGLVNPLLRGSAIGGGQGYTAGKYNDGKSNFLEALRGAQYSFSDKAGSGLGLNFDKALRVNTPFSITEKGFSSKPGVIDVNPGVLAGVAIDVVFGGKIDKLATKFIPKGLRSVKAIETGKVPTLEAPTTSTGVAQVGGELLATPKQLDLPFVTGPVPTNKVARTPGFKPRVPKPSKDVQQVLPIREMMDEFGAADRLTNPLAYKSGINPNAKGQLSLPLGKIDKSPLPPLNPLVKGKKGTSAGKQLKIEFDVLPEAVPPKIRMKADRTPPPEAVNSLDELPPAIRGKVLNAMERKTLAALDEVQASMGRKPDIGRRFSATPPDTGVTYTPVLPPNSLKSERISLDNVPFFHGTRVRDLDIPNIDPTKGAAFSELGTGVYITADNEIADLAARSAPSQGLPNVPGRELFSNEPAPGALPRGTVHELYVSSDAVIIDATKPIDAIRVVAENVASQFPELRGIRFQNKSLTEILTIAATEETSVGKRLQFQQKLTEALRAEGVDGVKAGDNYSIYNPQVLEETGRKNKLGLGGDYTEGKRSRHELEKWGFENSKSPIAEANMLDTHAEALSDELTTFELKKLLAANQVFDDISLAGLMDHPKRVPTLDEYVDLTVQDMFMGRPGDYDYKVPPIPVEDIKAVYARAASLVEGKGVSIKELEMEPGFGGFFYPAEGTEKAFIGMPVGAAESGDISQLKTLIHEITHAEIDKYVPYTAGTGVTINESIADSVANTVLSLLFPNQSGRRQSAFNDFFEYVNDSSSSYALENGATGLYNFQVLEDAGKMATTVVKETIEELSPGFKSPALSELRMFGANDYSQWAIGYFAGAPTLKNAFDSSLVTLADGLSDATKLGKMATNPVSGKLNTDVLDFLRTTFADELSLVDNVTPPKVINEWIDEILTAKDTNIYTREVAEKVKRQLERGNIDYNRHLETLMDVDLKHYKKYQSAAKNEIDDYLQRVYCGGN